MAKPRISLLRRDGPALERWPALVQFIAERRKKYGDTFSDDQNERFARGVQARFPGLEFTSLNTWGPTDDISTSASMQWEASRLIETKLVPEKNIPPAPKRVLYGEYGSIYGYARRLRRGLVNISVQIRDDLAEDHPLAFLRPSAIRALGPDQNQCGTLEEWRARERDRLRQSIVLWMPEMVAYTSSGSEPPDGRLRGIRKPAAAVRYRWRQEELEAVSSFCRETSRRYEELIDKMDGEDLRRPKLILVRPGFWTEGGAEASD